MAFIIPRPPLKPLIIILLPRYRVYFGSQNHPAHTDRIVQHVLQVPQVLLHHRTHSTQNKGIPLKSHNALPTCPSQ